MCTDKSISITDSPVERRAPRPEVAGSHHSLRPPQNPEKKKKAFFHVLVLGLLHLWFVVLVIYARRQPVWQFNSSYFSAF